MHTPLGKNQSFVLILRCCMFYTLISHKNQNQNQNQNLNLNLNPPYKTDICSEINFLTNSIVLTSHHVTKKKVFERYTNQVPQRQEPLSHLASQTRHGSTLSGSLSVCLSLSLFYRAHLNRPVLTLATKIFKPQFYL